MAFTVYRGGDEVRVNTIVAGDQSYPSVARLNDGGWIVAWQGRDAEGTGIYMQRYDARGTRVYASDVPVNVETAGEQYPPVVTALRDGGWVIAWQDLKCYEVTQQRYSVGGIAVATLPIAGSNPVTPGFANLALAGLPDGGWMVTWSGGWPVDIMQQRYSSSNATPGIVIPVDQTFNRQENYSSIATLNGGGWVVAWSTGFDRDVGADIIVQRFDDARSRVGAPVLIGAGDGLEQNRPKVATLTGGDFVVTWQTGTVANGYDIYQQRFSSNGTARGAAQLVSQYTTGTQEAPNIAALADGGWVITWSTGAEVAHRYYNASSETMGPDLRVVTRSGSSSNRYSSVAALSDGWVVTWQDNGADTSTSAGISQRAFRNSGGTVLSSAWEYAIGSADDDVLDVDPDGLVADVIAGHGGTDTMQVTRAGRIDLSATISIENVERLIGSSGDDVIVSDAARLAGITFIDGGAGRNTLELNSSLNPYDLTAKTIENIGRITLSVANARVLVDEIPMALLMHATQDGTTVELTVGAFTLEERLQLFRQGIDVIIADGGTYRSGAPDVGGLNGDEVSVPAGGRVRLDRGGDATVVDITGRFGSLTVIITNRDADVDGLGIDVGDGSSVTLSNGVAIGSVVSVRGTAIGTITADGGAEGLAIAFDEAATAGQIEELLHVLTYENHGTTLNRPRNIEITLANAGGGATSSSVTVEFGNSPPTLILPPASTGNDAGLLSLFADASVNDANGHTLTVTVKLDKAKGVLVATKGGRYDAATGTFTFTGSAGAATDALKGLQFDARDRSDPIGTIESTTFDVSVWDGMATSSGTLTVHIATANRAPAVPVLSGTSVEELSATGTVIGRLSAGDPNGGDTITYSLVGAPQGIFAIRGDALVVENDIVLDYEQATSHTFTIRATDAGGLFNDSVVTVSVSDVNPERTAGSSRDDRIVGGGAADVLSGGAGSDILFGRLGKDILRGDGGRDIFVFDTKPNRKTNVDTIKDFSVKDDSIWLDNAVFTKIGKGTPETPVKLKAGLFHIGKAAHDRDDRIVYDKTTGKLFYDEDGTGRKAAVEIAILKKNLKMNAADFFVI